MVHAATKKLRLNRPHKHSCPGAGRNAYQVCWHAVRTGVPGPVHMSRSPLRVGVLDDAGARGSFLRERLLDADDETIAVDAVALTA